MHGAGHASANRFSVPACRSSPADTGDAKPWPIGSGPPGRGGSSVTVASYPFPEGIIADVSITGTIFLQSDPRASPINYSGELDAAGICVPNGSAMLDARINFSMGSVYSLGGGASPSCNIPRMLADYSVRALIAGTATAVRGPLPVTNTWCNSPCTYTATGSQHVKIAPLAADLEFRGSYGGKRSRTLYVPSFVNAAGTTLNGYKEVIFTDSTVPRSMPLRNLSHAWFFGDPADPGDSYWKKTTNTCYAGNLICWVNIKESGLMTSTTRVNGVEHSDSVAIECALGDSLLDAPEPRAAMKRINAVGDGTNSNPLVRTEQDLLIARDNATGQMVTWPIVPIWTNQCKSGFNPIDPASSGFQGYTILAYVHTHPQYLNGKYPCSPTTSATGAPGGSVDDWILMQTINSPPSRPQGNPPVVMYVMANDYIYKMDPALGSGPDQTPIARWDKGRCKWGQSLFAN